MDSVIMHSNDKRQTTNEKHCISASTQATIQQNNEILNVFTVTDCYVTFVNGTFVFLNDHIAHVQNARQDTKYVHLTDIIDS